ncbi:MAG: UPF0182 family protein [Syntrophobacteraceae bacterium]|jgi:hypothetical protein|nr:UPF0182 family protein [Syntrophobacteraceae bacterium]
MVKLKSGFSILIGAAIAFLILVPVTGLLIVDFLVDMWWFDSLGYAFYFWQRLLYRYVVFGGVTLLFFLIFFLNFWVASRFLGTAQYPEPKEQEKRRAYKEILQLFRTGSMRVYTPLSLVLGVLVAFPLFEQWEAFLLYVFGPAKGITDPVFSKDISYYLFSFPIYTLLQRRILIAFLGLLAGILLLYWIERRLLQQQEQRMPAGARLHVSILIAMVFLIEIWKFILQRYELLYTGFHEPLFSGPGFAEMNVVLPLIWLCLLSLAGLGVSLLRTIHKGGGWKPLVAFAVLFALALVGRYSDFLPALVNEYIVKPNAITRESPYLQHNIASTLAAFKLSEVEVREIAPERLRGEPYGQKTEGVFRNIPIWDGDLLTDVFKHLQELRTYYDFSPVDVSHYTVRGHNQQVYLAARELKATELPEGARNWINRHLSFTHGYGVVMVPAGQGADEPMTWFIKGIPLESDFGFQVEQPSIYHGLLDDYYYAIAPNDAGEFGYPKGDTNVIVDYTGEGGVPINTLFKKLLFAYYFKAKDIFFTLKTNERSRILFRRNIRERIKILTPYLMLDNDPYLVVTPKRLYWIQDAYTYSDFYPYAANYSVGDQKLNYMRNSVKIVVDAYDGNVTHYVFDRQDPIVQAYERMYPGLLKDQSEMPPELKSQVRYPQDFFNTQMEVYSKYQQTDPWVFYQQEDLWEFAVAASVRVQDIPPVKSYYLTLEMIERGRFDFLLLAPMTPKGKSNLRALAVAGSDELSYGKLIVYSFPKGQLVFGPAQIHALINQDTQVAQQFTLWDQVGSEVERGRMIILPIGRVVFYIQPIYLKSSAELKIPELKRIIMSEGQFVVMETSLEDAYAKLVERSREEMERIERRYAPVPQAQQQPPPQPAPRVQPESTPAAQAPPAAPAMPEQQPPPEPKAEQPVESPSFIPPPAPAPEPAPAMPERQPPPEPKAEQPVESPSFAAPPAREPAGEQPAPNATTEGNADTSRGESPKN